MAETVHEEIRRLQREIGERQSRLQFLVLGDPRQSASIQSAAFDTTDEIGDAIRAVSSPK